MSADGGTCGSLSRCELASLLGRQLVRRDGRVVLLLGAGCSVSSGIPTATQLMGQWRENPEHRVAMERLERTRAEAEAAGLAPDSNIVPFYARAVADLFSSPAARQRETDRLCAKARPHVGYMVLAQLLRREDCQLQSLITPNFDNLIAEAYYLTTGSWPRQINHPDLAKYIEVSPLEPQVIKVHGDAKLSPAWTPDETHTLHPEIVRNLLAVVSDAHLVIVGYAGGDQGIAKLFHSMHDEHHRPSAITYVNYHEPLNPLRAALDALGYTYVTPGDFDEFMCAVQMEVGDRGLPTRLAHADLADAVCAKFRAIRSNLLESACDSLVSETSHRFKVPRIEVSPLAVKDDVDYAVEGDGRAPKDRALPQIAELYARRYAEFTNEKEAELRKAIDVRADREDPTPHLEYARFLSLVRREFDQAEAMYAAAIEVRSCTATHYGMATFLAYYVEAASESAVIREYDSSLRFDKANIDCLNGKANYLTRRAQDYTAAYRLYAQALKIRVNDGNTLANLAAFYLAQGDMPMAADTLHKAKAANDHGYDRQIVAERLFYEGLVSVSRHDPTLTVAGNTPP